MSNIEWTDRTWNPSRGCSRVSEGCRHCYAERVAHRFSGEGQPYEGLVDDKGRWAGGVRLVPERLADPLWWREPSMVFVDSMSDLFHPSIPDEYIAAVFGIMHAAHHHAFQVLTKRPRRALDWLTRHRGAAAAAWAARATLLDAGLSVPAALDAAADDMSNEPWPLPNVWLGVSVEDQATADERIPLLMQCPAAVRFVSYEPALGPVDFAGINWPELFRFAKFNALEGGGRKTDSPWRIDWLIVGGESGPGARPCDVEWIRSAVRQCRDAGVPCFVKQLGARPYQGARHDGGTGYELRLRDRKGGDPDEWREDLRVRQWPEVTP